MRGALGVVGGGVNRRWANLFVVTATLIAFALLLAGCGGRSAPSDPFVGTWHFLRADGTQVGTPFVIAKTLRGYTQTSAARLSDNSTRVYTAHMVRHGVLLRMTGLPRSVASMVITYLPDSGHLLVTTNIPGIGGPTSHEAMRTSDSTSLPSPQ